MSKLADLMFDYCFTPAEEIEEGYEKGYLMGLCLDDDGCIYAYNLLDPEDWEGIVMQRQCTPLLGSYWD